MNERSPLAPSESWRKAAVRHPGLSRSLRGGRFFLAAHFRSFPLIGRPRFGRFFPGPDISGPFRAPRRPGPGGGGGVRTYTTPLLYDPIWPRAANRRKKTAAHPRGYKIGLSSRQAFSVRRLTTGRLPNTAGSTG